VDINNADGSRKASSTGSSSSSRNGAGATAGCASDMSLDPNGLPHDDGSGSGAGGPDKKLVKMGLQTALAIGIHNFPEGLATFVATLDDPIVGAGLAIAIAVHNVPEGLCVSVPIYYATRDRWQAFKWAFISGISEPIGAGLGWLVLYRTMDDSAYGVVFGLVAGMMVNICISELLPTAFKYDPKDSIVTRCFVVGMAIMALSLVLFLNV
jgi:ZIP family zinc transporter